MSVFRYGDVRPMPLKTTGIPYIVNVNFSQYMLDAQVCQSRRPTLVLCHCSHLRKGVIMYRTFKKVYSGRSGGRIYAWLSLV